MSSPSTSSLSPSQGRFVYWFSGLAPVATNVVTPLMVAYRVRKQPLTVLKQQEMVMQEVARQIVSGAIGLLTYFGGGHLTKNLIELFTGQRKDQLGEAYKQIAMLVGGTALSFVGYGFIRPLFSTDIILSWLGRQPAEAAKRACDDCGKHLPDMKKMVSSVGKTSGRKAMILTAGFGAVLAVTDLLNWLVNKNRKKQPPPPDQVLPALSGLPKITNLNTNNSSSAVYFQQAVNNPFNPRKFSLPG